MAETKTKSYTVRGTDGNDYSVTVTAEGQVDVTSIEPLSSTTEPPIEPEPPEESGDIPLTWNHEDFQNCNNSSAVTVQNGQTLNAKSITDTGHTASIINQAGTVQTCRVNSREAVRIASGGVHTITGSYLEATGQGDDHADTIQAYSPGSRGTLKVSNSSIVAHNQAATAGLFIADNWTGTVELTDVVFQGGPYGCRIHPDKGGDNILKFRNVYFVGPFGYGPFLFSNYGGHRNVFEVWDNVRHATIQNGELVPGNVIPKPASTEVHQESMTKEKAIKEMKAGKPANDD